MEDDKEAEPRDYDEERKCQELQDISLELAPLYAEVGLTLRQAPGFTALSSSLVMSLRSIVYDII